MGLPQNARIHHGFSSAARKIGSLDGKLGSERNAFHHLAGDMAIRHGDGKRDCPDDLIAKNGYPVSLADVGKPIAEACCIAESSMLVKPDRRRGNAIKPRWGQCGPAAGK